VPGGQTGEKREQQVYNKLNKLLSKYIIKVYYENILSIH
jgi:hypothetical protein